MVSVAFGADISWRQSPKRVSVLEFSTAERVSERGKFFGARAGEARTERSCTMQQVASTGADGFLRAQPFVLSQSISVTLAKVWAEIFGKHFFTQFLSY